MEHSGSNSNLTSALLDLLGEHDEEHQADMSELFTRNQEKLLFWIGKPTTILGMFGSAYLCLCILRSGSDQVFRRFLLCVSGGHLALCVCMALSTIPTPKSLFYGSSGNEASCQAAGFLTHMAFGFTMFYHGAMGFYYIFIFFRGWTERQFTQKIEPILHGTAILVPLTGAIIGISTRMYGPNQLLLLCWVETGKPYRNVFVWLCGLIELNYFTVFKQMALVAIAITVYWQERKMKLRYSVNGSGAVASAASKVTRETLIQASIYFLSCFVPYALMMIMRYFDLYWKNIPEDGKVPSYLFGIAAAAQFLYPLQGIFAMTGFLRPDYLKRTQKFKEPFWQSLNATMRYQLGLAALHHDYNWPSSPATESNTFQDSEPQGGQGDHQEEKVDLWDEEPQDGKGLKKEYKFDAIAAC